MNWFETKQKGFTLLNQIPDTISSHRAGLRTGSLQVKYNVGTVIKLSPVGQQMKNVEFPGMRNKRS